MRISDQVYQELAAVVGKRYVRGEEYILAANRAKTPEVPFTYHTADVIVLPKTTEEVAEIVKICNRHKLCCIPFVTGALPDAYPKFDGTVYIHLKRMDKIIEINETDRYAIIEAGVRHIQFYPEIRKRGLGYPPAAVGPGGSVLANMTSTDGSNHVQHGFSRANRYLLGLEVVTPEGEIMRVGSLQGDAGWFCPDGPGPSIRGLMRGYSGTRGQFGIITKIAVGLQESNGSANFRSEGITPNHKVFLDDPYSRVYVFNYPHIQKCCDAMLALGEAEVCSTVQKYFYLPLSLVMTNSANEFWEKWDDFKVQMSMPLVIHIAAHTQKQLEYEEKILFEIIEETGGKRLPPELENWWTEHMDYFMLFGRLQSVLRLGGGWVPIKNGADSVQHMCDVAEAMGEYIHEYTDTGLIFDAPEDYQIIPMEYGHFAHIEVLYMWDRCRPGVMKGVGGFRARSHQEDIDRHYHSETPGGLNPATMEAGPLYCNYHLWLQRLKESFDPNNVANPMM